LFKLNTLWRVEIVDNAELVAFHGLQILLAQT
jgi:hypothetical protein